MLYDVFDFGCFAFGRSKDRLGHTHILRVCACKLSYLGSYSSDLRGRKATFQKINQNTLSLVMIIENCIHIQFISDNNIQKNIYFDFNKTINYFRRHYSWSILLLSFCSFFVRL